MYKLIMTKGSYVLEEDEVNELIKTLNEGKDRFIDIRVPYIGEETDLLSKNKDYEEVTINTDRIVSIEYIK